MDDAADQGYAGPSALQLLGGTAALLVAGAATGGVAVYAAGLATVSAGGVAGFFGASTTSWAIVASGALGGGAVGGGIAGGGAAVAVFIRNQARHVPNTEQDLREYPRPSYLPNDGSVIICITGASGTGKSSAINALRNKRRSDPEAAPVGESETTAAPVLYSSPFPNGIQRDGQPVTVSFFDLPGVGTTNHPQDTYIRNMGLRHYDLVVLVTADRLMEA